MKKSIFLFFAAILCATSALAHNLASGQYVYFEKPSDWTQATLLLGHNTYSVGYNMTKISNTNLYYWKTDSWNGYLSYAFIDAKVTSSDWGGEGNGDSSKPDTRKKWASHYSSTFTTAIAKCHLFNSTKSIKSSTTATDYATVVNRTQTIKVQLKDGSNWVDATVVPADLKASTYALTSSTAAGAKSASLAKESTTVSATVSAAYSAKVTLTCTNVLDGYVFEGWYDANGNKITSYTVSDAHTVYARFIQSAEETNEVKVTYMCGTTSVATAVTEFVGVETEKSFTAPTNITGYKFTNWTIGAGIDLKAGTASDATITVVTKSAASDYTLVANYEEVLETVYFINTPQWTGVKAYAYSPENHTWPGVDATKEAEKIGEKEVYSYTATQGKYANVIFNGSGGQTADLTWSEGVDKYYIHGYNGNTGWYTKAEAERLVAAPVVEETVYFVNNKNWTKVQAYAWNATGNNSWPGVALTATGEKVADYDVYSYTAPQGYVNVIFNNKTGDSGEQSADFVWKNGKYYYMGAAANYAGGTKEEVATALATPVPTYDYYVIGTINNWGLKDAAYGMELNGEVYEKQVTLAANQKHELKINNGDWDNNNTFGYDQLNVEYEGVSRGSGEGDNNIVIELTENKTITVKLYKNTKKVTLDGLTEKAVVKYDYYLTGSLVGGWDVKQQGIEKDGELYKATFTELNAGIYEFKITAGDWEHQWNYNNLGAAYEEVSQGVDGEGKPNGNIKIDTDEAINLTVIFDATAGKITLDGLTPYVAPLTYTVTVPAGTEKCYIAGSMNGWAFQEMEAVTGETNKFTITIIGAKETDEYKYACQADWAYAEVIEGGGNRTKWSALDEVTAWNAPAEPVEMASVVLMGVDGDWATGVEMELNPNDANEYMLLCQSITADEPIKIKAVDTQSTVTWCAKLADTSLGTVEKDADGNENIVLEEGKYDFYYKVAENEVWIGTCTETEPEYNVVEDEITNFVFNTEAWPMVCMGGPSTNYQVEVFLTLTEDADGTLAYEDCSVSIMGTDATFIDGTLSNIDVYAPSADAVLHVLWQEEYYELKLSMSAVSSAAPVDVMAADATVTFSDNEGALKFNGTNVYDDDAVYVELAGFEYNGAGEYTLNGAQISMFENTDAFAFADEVTVAIDEDGYVTVEGVYTSFNGGGIYNVHIWGALPKYTLTLSSDVSDATLTGSDTYYATQEVTVTATQELPGWVFDHWSDGDEKVSTDATYTFRIGKDLELTANYLEIYTRTVTSGSYGTICLPNGSVKVEGAKFYEVTFKKDGYIYADEVTELAAGMPYIFHATSTEVKVYYNETTAAAGSSNGVYGTFSNITDGDAGTTGNVLEGKYLLVAGPQVQKCAGNCSLAANRAYFVVSEISDVEQQSAPGRQRIALGCQDENQATGLDNITENGAVAPALQGTYDILGRQLSEPAVSGFYIINGKKVLVVK